MGTVEERLDRIEAMLETLVERQPLQEWFSTEEAGKLLRKAEFTVREWARRGRIRAQKRKSGRGAHESWAISRDEIGRYQREGLLPLQRPEHN